MPSASSRLGRLLPRVRLTRRRIIAGAIAVLVLGGLVAWAVAPEQVNYRTEDRMLTVRTGPNDAVDVDLDTRLYLPDGATAQNPVPAVLLAHGFGGTKTSVAADAEELAALGYAVLTWTAQGFGKSTGEIHLDSPDWEVKDAQRLIDWLAERPDIAKESAGDPRVAAVGGSYGGGLALMLAGADRRVDAIVPTITWNDLATAFLPDAASGSPVNGVFKRQWAGLFFGSSGGIPGGGGSDGGGSDGGGSDGGGSDGGGSDGGAGTPGDGAPVGEGVRPGGRGSGPDPQCGRFAKDVCAAYLSIAATGRATEEGVALLRRSSPASILSKITAPTLLVQGTADSLFPLSEADANARGIAATGTPVRVAWFTGGHDGGSGPQSEQDRVRFLTAQWLDHYLRDKGSPPSTSFTYSRVTGLNTTDRGVVASGFSVRDYPGLRGDAPAPTQVDLAGPVQQIANPPNGNPAAISSLPFAGALASFVNGVVTEVPGQNASFVSEPLDDSIDIVGAPTVRIRAASPTGEAVLFVKLYDVDQKGVRTLSNGLVAPVRLTGLPTSIEAAQPVTVTLPGIVRRIEPGHRLSVTIATSDQAYATPAEPAVYTVALDGPVSVPSVGGEPIANPNVIWRYVLAALLAAIAFGLAIALLVARRRRRNAHHSVVAEYADTPLVVRGLRKAYADGFVAVSTVDFVVERGQVVGMLGPNGAGKTTTLRVLMGLTRPTAGEVLVFGHRLAAGSPVLSRVGALVEGPGFLPHLTGQANLDLYWKATGRPAADARMDDALEIAGLGDAVHRKVKTYSHGMRQRLAIAQAMLGLPELLVLDEPTDGLDPPQIAEMRRVLRRYATDGRAVLVSSHLLAEVEQTCTEVVVMHKGLIVAAGKVDDIVGDSPSVQLDVSDVPAAETVLHRLTAVRSVASSGNGGLIVDIDGAPRSDVVAALVNAGVGVDRVVPRRRLEDAFLALVGGDTKASGER
ncbi:MAG TPA: alpha/beta fold hydrolase [Micromonosporaceae bacterium]|nr:alpha/beta fold hydrolase [Micromonosporaceae bacterium]